MLCKNHTVTHKLIDVAGVCCSYDRVWIPQGLIYTSWKSFLEAWQVAHQEQHGRENQKQADSDSFRAKALVHMVLIKIHETAIIVLKLCA